MTDKAKNVLSYIIPIVGIVFMLMKENSKEVKLVGAQATTLFILNIAIRFIYRLIPIYIPFLMTALSIAYLVFVIIGIVNVCNEKDLELPLIGKLAKAIFGKAIEA